MATRRAQRAATEVIAGSGAISLAEMIRGKGPTESRYLYIKMRDALLGEQDEARKVYDKALSFDDSKGSATNLLASLEHRTFDDVAFGLGYSRYDYRVESSSSDLDGRFSLEHQGWLIATARPVAARAVS